MAKQPLSRNAKFGRPPLYESVFNTPPLVPSKPRQYIATCYCRDRLTLNGWFALPSVLRDHTNDNRGFLVKTRAFLELCHGRQLGRKFPAAAEQLNVSKQRCPAGFSSSEDGTFR